MIVGREDFVENYRANRPKYYDFTTAVEHLLKTILESRNIDVVNIESRTKSVESFEDKISREDKRYTDPLLEVTDLSACRIICYYNKDIDLIDECIRNNFDLDEENSVAKDKKANPREFGYLSRHLVVSFNDDRLKLDEYSRFSGMKIELQVRTGLQHAWAAIEHKLQYKNQVDVPEPLQRKLFQISALLELADDEFAYLRTKLGKLRETYESDLKAGDIPIPINVDSIDIYTITSPFISDIKVKISKIGFNIAPTHPFSKNPLSKLIESLQIAKISSVSEIESLIVNGTSKATWVKNFKDLYRCWKRPGNPANLVIDVPMMLRIMVIMQSDKATANKILKTVPIGESLRDALNQMIDGAN